MFPKAQVAKKGGTKRDLSAEKEDKPEYIPETRLNQHPLTSGIRMHPVSGGSLFKNGINGMTFEEFQKEKLHQVESLGRPAHGLSEACQTFETAVSFLQAFLENEILGNGMEQVRKQLAS